MYQRNTNWWALKYLLFHTMMKYIKQILDKSKLVLNNLDNSRQTKLDLSILVFKKSCQFASYKTRQVQTCLKQSCQFTSYKPWQVSTCLKQSCLFLIYNIPISHHDEILVYTCLDNPVKSLAFSPCFSYYFLYFFPFIFILFSLFEHVLTCS